MIEAVSKPPLVAIKEVDFAWHAKANLTISSGNLCIKEHEHVFIRGASGSGKSTLLNIIGGIVTPQKGQVDIIGQDFCQLKELARDRFEQTTLGLSFSNLI